MNNFCVLIEGGWSDAIKNFFNFFCVAAVELCSYSPKLLLNLLSNISPAKFLLWFLNITSVSMLFIANNLN